MIWELCLGQLAEITEGQIQFGSLPPLAGNLEPIRRIVLDANQVSAGDVYWDLDSGPAGSTKRTEESLIRGGLGAVVSGQQVEPWAGRFILHVANANTKLAKLIRCCPAEARAKTFIFDRAAVEEWQQHNILLDKLIRQPPRGWCPTRN